MITKFFTLISVIGLASICLVQGQSPTPGESPAASPSPAKHRAHKKTEATASPAQAASPSTAESPAASPSPKKPRSHKKAEATAAASPAPTTRTTTAATTKATPAPGGGHGLVWVNTDSHIYHKEGSRFYGKTKNGKYMSEADAIKEGNRAGAKEF
jgi:outer membrane biosynthesis protein TonB